MRTTPEEAVRARWSDPLGIYWRWENGFSVSHAVSDLYRSGRTMCGIRHKGTIPAHSPPFCDKCIAACLKIDAAKRLKQKGWIKDRHAVAVVQAQCNRKYSRKHTVLAVRFYEDYLYIVDVLTDKGMRQFGRTVTLAAWEAMKP